ncbi:MAG: hypothetical protein H7234_07975 [Herminiimonas sp.]|nr:hypothetical protein [Herminiimonas sp.]
MPLHTPLRLQLLQRLQRLLRQWLLTRLLQHQKRKKQKKQKKQRKPLLLLKPLQSNHFIRMSEKAGAPCLFLRPAHFSWRLCWDVMTVISKIGLSRK